MMVPYAFTFRSEFKGGRFAGGVETHRIELSPLQFAAVCLGFLIGFILLGGM
jgi:hypothetical protein